MSLKVLVISNYRETVSVRPEAELFLGLKEQGVNVEIMTYGDAEYAKRFREAGIRVIDFHPEKKLDSSEIRKIRETLKEGRHDILHLFNGKAIINGIQAARGLPVKVVLYRGYTGNIHWYDPTAYLKYLHPRVDKIFCIAKSIETLIRRQLISGKNKPVTIHKGHDPAWYSRIPEMDRAALEGPPADGFRVVNVANNRPMKGIPYLIRAMHYLPPELNIHLVIVGKNMDIPGNRKLAGNTGKVHFTGYRKDVLSIVKASDVFALSSLRGEATTKAVIEAMSLGVAPVITDIPGNRELVIHEKCGLVVPPADPEAMAGAILRLYENREERQKYATLAKAHIMEHFHIRDTIRKTKELYEELVQ